MTAIYSLALASNCKKMNKRNTEKCTDCINCRILHSCNIPLQQILLEFAAPDKTVPFCFYVIITYKYEKDLMENSQENTVTPFPPPPPPTITQWELYISCHRSQNSNQLLNPKPYSGFPQPIFIILQKKKLIAIGLLVSRDIHV